MSFTWESLKPSINFFLIYLSIYLSIYIYIIWLGRKILSFWHYSLTHLILKSFCRFTYIYIIYIYIYIYTYIYINLYIWLTISSCYGSLTIGLIGKDLGLSTLVSYLQVCLSTEVAKNVSWRWLSPLPRWGSLTMVLTRKFVYIYIYIYIYSCSDIASLLQEQTSLSCLRCTLLV